jgi:hypothetical protein
VISSLHVSDYMSICIFNVPHDYCIFLFLIIWIDLRNRVQYLAYTTNYAVLPYGISAILSPIFIFGWNLYILFQILAVYVLTLAKDIKFHIHKVKKEYRNNFVTRIS